MYSSDVDGSDPDVAAIVRTAKEFSDAVAAGDVDRVMNFYSADIVYMSPGVPDAQGRDAVAKNWTAMLSTYGVRVEVQILEVKILGDHAYDRAKFTMVVAPKAGGENGETSGRVFEVLRKEHGAWKSFRVMVNSDK
ncbi:MAG: SgcJ/EcaC family oxidoreductase [Thermoplasmata archaeon]